MYFTVRAKKSRSSWVHENSNRSSSGEALPDDDEAQIISYHHHHPKTRFGSAITSDHGKNRYFLCFTWGLFLFFLSRVEIVNKCTYLRWHCFVFMHCFALFSAFYVIFFVVFLLAFSVLGASEKKYWINITGVIICTSSRDSVWDGFLFFVKHFLFLFFFTLPFTLRNLCTLFYKCISTFFFVNFQVLIFFWENFLFFFYSTIFFFLCAADGFLGFYVFFSNVLIFFNETTNVKSVIFVFRS